MYSIILECKYCFFMHNAENSNKTNSSIEMEPLVESVDAEVSIHIPSEKKNNESNTNVISTQPKSPFPSINNSSVTRRDDKIHKIKNSSQNISSDINEEEATSLNNNHYTESESPRAEISCCEEVALCCIKLVD